MIEKVFKLLNKGMRRDLSVSKAGESSVFENHNIRILARDNDTLLSVTNERGNKKIADIDILGTVIGWNTLNNNIVVFSHDTVEEDEETRNVDRIYRIIHNTNHDENHPEFRSTLLFEGDLNFNNKFPIESVVYHETENIQKIYWVDGRNVLRFMNFADQPDENGHYSWQDIYGNYDNTYFDSNRKADFGVTVSITKNNSGVTRPNGVAQYLITYFNKHGQETSYVWFSDIVYLSPLNTGGAADGTNNNNVVLSISGLDTTFTNFRVYSIFRSTNNGNAVAYLVAEQKTTENEIKIVDDFAHSEVIDLQSLLYLGSRSVIAETLSSKDETLFLGGLTSIGKESFSSIEKVIEDNMFGAYNEQGEFVQKPYTKEDDGKIWEAYHVSFAYSNDTDGETLGLAEATDIPYVGNDGNYSYESQLNLTSSAILSFKGGEKYRFALKFKYPDGSETDAFWIGDKVNPLYPVMDISERVIKRVVAKCFIPKKVLKVVSGKFSAVQLMIADAENSDRAIKAQGIINPTMFNVWERFNNRLYSIPSWISRPRGSAFSTSHFNSVRNSITSSGEIQCNYWKIKETSTETNNANNETGDEIIKDSVKYPYFQYEYSEYPRIIEEFDGKTQFNYLIIIYGVVNYGSEISFFQPFQYADYACYYRIIKASNLNEDNEDAIRHLLEYKFDLTDIKNWRSYDDEHDADKKRWTYKEVTNKETGEFEFLLEHTQGSATGDIYLNHGGSRDIMYAEMRDDLNTLGLGDYIVPEEIFDRWCVQCNESGTKFIKYYNAMCFDNEWFNIHGYMLSEKDLLNIRDDTQAPDDPPSEHRWIQNNNYDRNTNNGNTPSFYKKHLMFIDENVVTLDSPEISYNKVSFDGAEHKFRIVGVAKMSSIMNDYIVEATDSKIVGENLETVNLSGKRPQREIIDGIISWPLWKEAALDLNSQGEHSAEEEQRIPSDYTLNTVRLVRYWLHMWHSVGSIIGYADEDGKSYSMLKKKTFANTRFSYNTIYLDNSITQNLSYEPDFVRVPTESNDTYKTLNIGGKMPGAVPRYYDSRPELYLGMPGVLKYPLLYSYATFDGADAVLSADGAYLYSASGVILRYSSQSHAVIGLPTIPADEDMYTQTVLPVFFDGEKSVLDRINMLEDTSSSITGALIPWIDFNIDRANNRYRKYHIDYIHESFTRNDLRADDLGEHDNYLLVGEIYEDYVDEEGKYDVDRDTRYGGIKKANVSANRFISAGPQYPIVGETEGIQIIGNQGDTYIQRYDALRIKPYSEDSENNVIDITSVMLETHINLDGRTDLMRGIAEIASIDTTKFGSLNDVYSQKNSFIVRRDLDEDFNVDSYPASITWTLPKANAAQVDEWSHITLASTLALDGDKGKCTAIRRYGNGLVAFQERAISEILFNTRTQLATQEGVPVEIANSGKVDGKRYITNKYGCTNKWSIVEGKSALYFVDNINKAFCSLGSGITNISAAFGFSSWFRRNNNIAPWNPEEFNNLVAFYDKVHSDIYLVKNDDGEQPCLVYNETINAFTSFFDYGSVNMMSNIDDKFVSMRNGGLWLQNEGLYCNFFGRQYPFWIQYRVSPDIDTDKIWSTVEYRADFYRVLSDDGNDNLLDFEDITNLDEADYQEKETFDSISVWNEYQSTGEFTKVPEKKFRTWRYQIPRAASNDRNLSSLDRIRNPWVNLILKKTQFGDENKDLMQLHDVDIKYFE